MNYFILVVMAVTISRINVTETKNLLEDASKRVGESFLSNSEKSEETGSSFISFDPPRSVKDFLNIWINGLALTGLRVGFHPYKYYNQIFGDPPKEAKEALRKEMSENEVRIKALNEELRQIKTEFKDLKTKTKHRIARLHERFKEDVEFLLQNDQEAKLIFREFCGDENCREYASINDLLD